MSSLSTLRRGTVSTLVGPPSCRALVHVSLLTITFWLIYRGVADRHQDHLIRAYSRDWVLGHPRRLCVFADLHRRVGGLWSQYAEV